MSRCVAFLALAVAWMGAAAAAPLRFDMGTDASPVKPGCVRVTPKDTARTRGAYGWLTRPDSAYYDSRCRPADALLSDGCQREKAIVFGADVPQGEWWVEVSVGAGPSDRRYRVEVAAGEQRQVVGVHRGQPHERGLARAVRFAFDGGGRVTIRVRCGDSPARLAGVVFRRRWTNRLARRDDRLVADPPLESDEFDRGNDLLAAGDREGALVEFSKVRDARARAEAMLWVAGRLGVEDPVAWVERAADLMRAAGDRDRLTPVESFLQAVEYYEMGAWEWAREKTGTSVWNRFALVPILTDFVTADRSDPLYWLAMWYRARMDYWQWRESGGGKRREAAIKAFEALKGEFPDHRLVRIYLGEKLPSGTQYTDGADGAPQWAVKQREAICRCLEVIHYWAGVQAPNGEMGGGFSDDCEILRWWPVALLGADDPVAQAAVRKMAMGIWASRYIEGGYQPWIGDVEHSAEPVADTQPIMCAVDYGDPLFIERCMQTMKCMRDVWLGASDLGHAHFRSAWLSATRVSDDPLRAADVPYNTRAAKPGRWVAWYNRNPAVTKMFHDWGRAWVADTLREADGKPAGVIPAVVFFPDDSFTRGDAPWYRPNLGHAYYGWRGGGMMREQWLDAYAVTGDRGLLRGIEAGIDLALRHGARGAADAPEGSQAWAARRLFASMGRSVARWRHYTRDRRYDDYLKARGTPYAKFRLTGDIEPLIRACQSAIDSTKYNTELLTTEAKFTDRVYVSQADTLLAMMTGALTAGAEFPSYAVTWLNTGKDFAALVRDWDETHVVIWAYNFEPQPREVALRFWGLEDGAYRLQIGDDADGDGAFDGVPASRAIDVVRCSQTPLRLPPRRLQLIRATQTRAHPRDYGALPDLAIGRSDVRRQGGRATVTVHNIGSAPAPTSMVTVRAGGRVVGHAQAPPLDAPLDLEPRTAQVTVTCPPTGPFDVTVEPVAPVDEITTANNTLRFE